MDTTIWQEELHRVISRYYETGTITRKEFSIAHRLYQLLLDNDRAAARRFTIDIRELPVYPNR
jgi:hypothetical protein